MKRTRNTYTPKTPAKKVAKTTNAVAMYKQPTNPIRFIKRHADIGVRNGDSITNSYYGESFTLNQVPGYTELTTLYDQYKINAIELTWYPRNTEITPFTTAPNNARILIRTDYSDATAPTSLNVIREYENCKVFGFSEKFTWYIDKPKILDSSSSNRTAWIATTDVTQKHYGIKFAMEPFGAGGQYGWAVEACFYLAFKNVK